MAVAVGSTGEATVLSVVACENVSRAAAAGYALCCSFEHSMDGWVAVTHSDWFDFLAQQRQREEVNFWSPSDYYAFHGAPGSPFFFKLTSPRNAIGGFGYVASFSRLPEWLAWECFGEGNGAATFHDLKARLDRIRDRNKMQGAGGLSQIGCIILVQAVFSPASSGYRNRPTGQRGTSGTSATT